MLGRRVYREQHGFSLTELLVSLATSMFLLAGVLGMFSSTLASQGANLKQTRLNQELRNIMDLMSRDMRRAGYWEQAAWVAQPAGNIELTGAFDSVGGTATVTSSGAPFANLDSAALVGRKFMSGYGSGTVASKVSSNVITVTIANPFSTSHDWINEGSWMMSNLFTETANDLTISADNQCIQYTYDRDGDATVDDDEKFAFRLHDGVVQMYAGTGTAPNCTTGAGEWVDVSSDSINITELTFDDDATTCINLDTGADCDVTTPASGDVLVYQRQVDITLVGALASNSSVSRKIEESVRFRNDVIKVY